MTADKVRGLAGVSSSTPQDYAAKGYHYLHEADPAALPAVAHVLREEGFHLELATCLDQRAVEGVGAFCLVYQFNRHGPPERHVVRARLAPGQEATSIAGVYAGADWYEREIYDMFGVGVAGHPDLKRILMPEDYVGHPLLRDFVDQDPERHRLSGVVVQPGLGPAGAGPAAGHPGQEAEAGE